jgi:predicted neutral ceramidase superfamily lipid hydrolase
MRSNLSEVNIQPWAFYDYQLIDFLQNKTVFCPIKSQWIHFEAYLFTAIGLFITSLVTVRIHVTEMRFRDYHALFRCHTMNACLTGLFLISFLFNTHSTETTCRWEQVLIQYFSTILIATIFLMAFVRHFDKHRDDYKLRWTCFIYLISLLVQTLLTVVWLISGRMKPSLSYHRQTCFHRIQINLCFHAQLPLLFSTLSLPIVFLLTAANLYRSTRPFAIAQLLESIMCAIGLIMGGSMWYMNLFFSNYPQMPYKYVACVFLLTYMLPR